jgi:hypothetical protein
MLGTLMFRTAVRLSLLAMTDLYLDEGSVCVRRSSLVPHGIAAIRSSALAS